MAVKIRLKRMGKIHAPFYRVVIMNSRTKRDGRAIEEIGKYHPTHEPSVIEIDSARVQYWLGVGAQPTEQVAALLKITGDWQKFKGLPGTEGTLRVAEPKRDKTEIFNEALKDAANEPKREAVTKKAAQKAKKVEEPKVEEPKVEEPKAEEAAVEAPAAAEETPAAAPVAEEAPATEAPAADETTEA